MFSNDKVLSVSVKLERDSVRFNVTWKTFVQFLRVQSTQATEQKPTVSAKVREFLELLFTESRRKQ